MPLTQEQKRILREKFPALMSGAAEPEAGEQRPSVPGGLTDEQRNALRRTFGLPGAVEEPAPPSLLSRLASKVTTGIEGITAAITPPEPVGEAAFPTEAPSLATLPTPPGIPLGRAREALLAAPTVAEAQPTAFGRVGRKVQEAIISLFPTEEEFQTGAIGRFRAAVGIQPPAPGEKPPTKAEKVLAPAAFPIIVGLKGAELGVRAVFAPFVGAMAGLQQGLEELGLSETDAARLVKDVEAGFISTIVAGPPIPRGQLTQIRDLSRRLMEPLKHKVDLSKLSFEDFVKLAEERGDYQGLLKELRKKSPERANEVRDFLRERSRGGFQAGQEAAAKARGPVAAIPERVGVEPPVARPTAPAAPRPPAAAPVVPEQAAPPEIAPTLPPARPGAVRQAPARAPVARPPARAPEAAVAALPEGVTEQDVFDRIQAIRKTTEDIASGKEPGRVVIFDPEALAEGRKRPIGVIRGEGKTLDLVAEVFDEVSAVADVAPGKLVEAIKKDKENPIYQRLKRAVVDQVRREAEEGIPERFRPPEEAPVPFEVPPEEAVLAPPAAAPRPARPTPTQIPVPGLPRPEMPREGIAPEVPQRELEETPLFGLERERAEQAAREAQVEIPAAPEDQAVRDLARRHFAQGIFRPPLVGEDPYRAEFERLKKARPEIPQPEVEQPSPREAVPAPIKNNDRVRLTEPFPNLPAGAEGTVMAAGPALRVNWDVGGIVDVPRRVVERVEARPGDTPTPVTAEPTATPLPPKEAPPQEASRLQPLVNALTARLRREAIGDNAALRELTDEVMGGTIAQGVWDYQDAYDALEVAANIVARERGLIAEDGAWPLPERIRGSRDIQGRLTKLSARTVERIQKQQFSTPLPVAQLVAAMAQVRRGETVLEPSAGTGALLAPIPRAEVTILTNETAQRRRDLLRLQGFEPTAEDGLRIYQGQQDVDVVVMNPPWKSIPRRAEEFESTELAAFHVAQALRRLRPGGRLVAVLPGRSFVTGEPAGFTPGAAATRDFFRWLGQRYTVRANLGLPGKEYGAKGAEVPFQILVVDNVGPTTELSPPPLTGNFSSVEQAGEAIATLPRRAEGPILVAEAPSHARTEPVGRPAVPPREPVGLELPPAGGLPGTGAPGAGRPGVGGPGRPGGPGRGAIPLPGGGPGGVQRPAPPVRPVGGGRGPAAPTPVVPPGAPGLRPAPEGPRVAPPLSELPGGVPGPARPEELAGGPPERPVGPLELGRPTLHERASKVESPEGEGALVPYQPAFQSGQRHPTIAMEPLSLAGVSPPAIKVDLKLPRRLLDSGALSREQVDTVAFATQTHELRNPDGSRRGFWLADMTGFGKGRQLAALIYENALRGNRRAVWVSASPDLLKDTVRDLSDLNVPLKVHELRRLKGDQPIPWTEGVIFVNYDLVRMQDKSGNRRLDQLLSWLKNYQPGGVLLLDEIHKAKNAVTAGGLRQASKVGQTMVELQVKLPEAKVVYSTATAVTEPINMGYMTRLGLWGSGTQFVGDDLDASFLKFSQKMNAGGLGMSEALVRDLKAMGQYLGRSISFGEPGAPAGQRVEYAETIHDLTPEQRRNYDRAAEVWLAILREGIENAKIVTGETKSRAQKILEIRMFWNTHQRFFKTLTAAFKVPTVLRRTQELLDTGHSVVISLDQTREEQQDRAVKEALLEERDLEDIDLSPRQAMLNFIDRFVPVNRMVAVTDQETGALLGFRRETDAAGNPIADPLALERRNRLKELVGDFAQTENPIDAIINHFGERVVAELSGRKRRLRVNPLTGKVELINRRVEGAKAKDVNNAERDAFQAGKKRVAIITRAASTGISLHDDPRAANANRRVMLMMELDWSADTNLQRMGRIHRAGQRSFPLVELVTTDVGGEKRFASTVARRLSSLGALSRGQRQAVAAGEIAKYDFESSYGQAAVDATLQDLMHAGAQEQEALRRMGFLKSDPRSGNEYLDDDIVVSKLLNRLLSLDVASQNAIFERFAQHFDRIVAKAREDGVFDEGVRTLRGVVKSEVVRQEVLLVDQDTNAETRYIEIALSRPAKRTALADATVRVQPQPVRGTEFQAGDFVRLVRGEELGRITQTLARDPQRPLSADNVRFVVQKPVGDPSFVLPTSIKGKVGPQEAAPLWERLFAESEGKLLEERRHLIAGRIIPFYEQVVSSVLGERNAAEVDLKLQVLQLNLSDGGRVVGYDIPAGRIDAVLDALKLERGAQPSMTPEEALDFVLAGNELRLSNGVSVRRERFQSEEVLAVKGLSTSFRQKASDQYGLQVFQDPGGRWRFFVPKNRDRGAPALRNLMQEFPQPEGKRGAQAPPKPPGQREAERRGVAEPEPETFTRRVAAPPGPAPSSPLRTGWRPPSSVPAHQRQEVRKADIIRILSEGLSVPIRIGKFRQRALGIFKKHPRVIRLRNAGDVATAAHEAGHLIQRVYFHLFGSKALKDIRGEVEALAIPGGPPFNEGFAEFVRLYVQDPAAASARAPNLLNRFEGSLLPGDSEILGVLIEARDLLALFESQPPEARVEAQIHRATDTKHMAIKDMWDRFQTAVLDDLHHIEVAERALLLELPEIPADQKPYLLGRISRGQEFGIAELFLKNGVVDFETLAISGKPLQGIYQEAERLVRSRGSEEHRALAEQGLALRVLDRYLIARRVPDYIEAGLKTGIRPKDAEATVAALSYLEPVAQDLDAFQDGLWEFAQTSYGMSDAESARIRRANRNYAPFYRFIEDESLQAMGVTGKKGFANQPLFFRRRKGGEQEILPPTESILKNTYATVHMAIRNNVAAALVNLAGRREGRGFLVEKVPGQVKPTTFELERIKKTLTEAGFEITDEQDLTAVATVFSPTKQPGRNEIGVWIGGQKQFYQIGDVWLWRSLTALDKEAARAFVKILQLPVVRQVVVLPARLRRATATTFSPEFILRNPFRDNLEAFLLAEFGFRPGIDLWRGVAHAVGADEVYQAWLAGGGPLATLVSMDRLNLQKTMQNLLERGLAAKVMKVVRNPLEGLRTLSEAMEIGTRIGAFDRALRKIEQRESGRPRPLPTAKEALDSLGQMGKRRAALVEAGLASREATIDFGRMGLYTKGLSMMTAFWNANVQGLDRLRRRFRDDPKATFKRGLILTVASLLIYLANRDDPDYIRLAEWRRGTGWNFKVGNTWIWLPMPWLGGLVFAVLPTRIFEFIDGKDRKTLDRIRRDVGRLTDVVPFVNAWPTAVEPLVENTANWKFFFDRPIVPRALEGVDPVFQATRHTSEVAKALSKAAATVGVRYSPAKIENVILSWTTGLGRIGLESVDLLVEKVEQGPPRPARGLADLPLIRAFVQRYPTMQAQPIVDFWELFRDAEQAANTKRLLTREGRGEEMLRFVEANRERIAIFNYLALRDGFKDQMQNIRKQMDAVDRATNMSPEQKRLALDRLTLNAIKVAEAGLVAEVTIRATIRENLAAAKRAEERRAAGPLAPKRTPVTSPRAPEARP